MYVTQVTIQCLAQVGKIKVEVDPGRNLLCFCAWVCLCMHSHRNGDNKVCVQGQTHSVCVCLYITNMHVSACC